jgi:hypothetical protein
MLKYTCCDDYNDGLADVRVPGFGEGLDGLSRRKDGLRPFTKSGMRRNYGKFG